MSETRGNDTNDEPTRRTACPFNMALPLARRAVDMAPHQAYGYVALSLTSNDFRERTGATIKAVEASRENDPKDVVGRAGLLARLLLEPRRWREEEVWRVWQAHGVLRGTEQPRKEASWRYEEEEVYERVREALKEAWKEFDDEDYDDDTTTTSCTTSLTNSSDDTELDGKDESDSDKESDSEEKDGDDCDKNDENDIDLDQKTEERQQGHNGNGTPDLAKTDEKDLADIDANEAKESDSDGDDRSEDINEAILYLTRIEYRLGMLFRTIQPSKVHRPRSRKHLTRALKHLPTTHPLHETITFWLKTLKRKEMMEKARLQRSEPAVAALINYERRLDKGSDGSCSSFSDRYDGLMMDNSENEAPNTTAYYGDVVEAAGGTSHVSEVKKSSSRPRWHVDLVEEANPTSFWGKAFGMYYL